MNGEEWTWGDLVRMVLFLAVPVVVGNFLTDAVRWLVRRLR